MPRNKIENARIRKETQNKIMDFAIDIFSKKGFAKTTINDIAESANISVGLMYRYFNSKQDLFDKIIDMAVDGLHGLIQLANQSNTPKETFEILCQEMLDSMNDENYIKLSLMITQGLMSQDNPSFEKIMSADEKMIEAFANLIKKGQEQGIFAIGDSTEKVCLFMSTVQGMTLMKSLFKEKFKPPTVRNMMSFLLKGENNGSNN